MPHVAGHEEESGLFRGKAGEKEYDFWHPRETNVAKGAPEWDQLTGGDSFGGQEAQNILRQQAALGMKKLLNAPDESWTSEAAMRKDLAEGQSEIARMGAASGTQERRAAMGLSGEQQIGAQAAEREAQLGAQLGAQAQLSAGIRDQYQKLGETRRKNLEQFAMGVLGDEAKKEQEENAFLQELGPDLLAAVGDIVVGAVAASDIRLKKNIDLVGQSDSGINIYEWNYIWGGGRYRGAMAQELLEVHPEAVSETAGYYAVNYDKIDVDFQQVNVGG